MKKKTYRIHLQPISETFYAYEVEANNQDEAVEEAFELLRDNIGWDAAKDWECNFIEEEKDDEHHR